ncbi:MAG TPA: potassium channel protein [Deltaproteobacteria bacterium]|nr:potassium channel protein [Deltaproteobacteria bacterium]
MKYIPAIFSTILDSKNTRQNIRLVLKFIVILAVMVTVFSVLFHVLMALEGSDYSWITGFYWTLTVMTTLGFGDITFHSDLGRAFSIVVLLSGVVFFLTLLPFIFIKFFYAPWLEAESRTRTPREMPPDTRDHIIITSLNPVTFSLIEKLKSRQEFYILIEEDPRRATELYDAGIRVAIGSIDDPRTYQKLRVEQASLVVAASSDEINTNIAFTIRELSEDVPIIATADSPYSVDVLEMAGSTKVLQIYKILGRSLATWTFGGDCGANIISRFENLLIAEFPVFGTPLVGKTLAESNLRQDFGVTVVGIWSRGKFEIPNADTRINKTSVFVLAGGEENLAAFDDVYSFYHIFHLAENPVLIIGGGRVGRNIAERFKEQETPYLIIDKKARPVEDEKENAIIGNAADILTLQKANIDKVLAGIITTHDDATNIYLTKYLRSLRPDMLILSRSNLDRNVSTLHRAGADFVMSYASLGANAIYNFHRNEDTFLLAEGLNIFRHKAPRHLVGKNLIESKIRESTNCSVVALDLDGVKIVNPDPLEPIRENTELILIGDYEGEKKFVAWSNQEQYKPAARRRLSILKTLGAKRR